MKKYINKLNKNWHALKKYNGYCLYNNNEITNTILDATLVEKSNDWVLSCKIHELRGIDNVVIVCNTFEEICNVYKILGKKHSFEYMKCNHRFDLSTKIHVDFKTKKPTHCVDYDTNIIDAIDFINSNPVIIKTNDDEEIYDLEQEVYLLDIDFNLTKCKVCVVNLDDNTNAIFLSEDYAKKCINLNKPKFSFKTTDNVVINNPKQDVFMVFENYTNKIYNITEVIASEAYRLPLYNYFSSKQKAEEYINDITLKYSKNDILKIYENFNNNNITNFKEYLKTI